jgi:RHS repeat-associated protein
MTIWKWLGQAKLRTFLKLIKSDASTVTVWLRISASRNIGNAITLTANRRSTSWALRFTRFACSCAAAVLATTSHAQFVPNAEGYYVISGSLLTIVNGTTQSQTLPAQCNPTPVFTTVTDIPSLQALATPIINACIQYMNSTVAAAVAGCQGARIFPGTLGAWTLSSGGNSNGTENRANASTESEAICGTTAYQANPSVGVISWQCSNQGPYPTTMGTPGQCNYTNPQLYFIQAPPPALAQTSSPDPAGDPVNPALGNVYNVETDITFATAGSVAYRRYYNSADGTGVDGTKGWRHSYDQVVNILYQSPTVGYSGQTASTSGQYTSAQMACTQGFPAIKASVSTWASATVTFTGGVCVVSSGGTTIATLPVYVVGSSPVSPTVLEYDVVREDGQTVRFPVQGGVVLTPIGVSLRFAVTGSGFTVTDENDTVETYNTAGALQSITSRAGVVQNIFYDAGGKFLEVFDSFGNSLTVSRTFGEITTLTASGGGVVHYGFDSNSRLNTVTNLDSTSRTYVYADGLCCNQRITSIIDEAGATYATWHYDAQHRATSSQLAGGAFAQTLAYNPDGTVTVTDGLGAARTFSFMRSGDINRVNGITGSQCPTCQDSKTTTYDQAGWIASRVDYNGNLTCYSQDPVRGVELVRVEGFAPGSTCPTNLATYSPTAGTLQRKITTQWSATWREPSLITEPNRTAAFTFYANGSINTQTVTDTSVSPNVSRTWTYTYNSFGQVLTIDGPRTDVVDKTTYTYNSCSSGFKCGQIATIQNALGQVTTFSTYNAYGEPLTITDPNGVVSTFTYDARERLSSAGVGTETTSFTYWPIGLLSLVTQPDGSTIQSTYDGAHRLTKLTDELGNYVSYTLDALGNRIGESSYDASSLLHRTHTRMFNALGQLYQEINAANTSVVTTTYGYDAQGNQTSIDAPLSRNIVKVFDSLNRIDQITDAHSGITKLSYDANDSVASVIDPRTLTTTYTHNGFNQVTMVVSPDTATSSKNYDSGGNLSTTTDARNAVATYSYDALNRETQVEYTDNTINFTYDAGTNGKGRLTGASDASHTLSWAYDSLGRVTGKAQKINSVTKSVGYAYTKSDLTSLVTPSGQTIAYTYTNHRITSIKVGTTTLLSNVTYDPFGPATGWTWGNSTTVSRVFDEDGYPHQIVTAGVTNLYTVDSASRITGISDSGLSSNSWTFGYDTLDRVTSGSSSAKSRGYTYDANSGRLTTTGTTASTETISATSNRLNSTSGGILRTYGYDAAGNTTSFTGETFTFAQNGRMSSATSSAGSTTYYYNALGQLIEKTGNGGNTILVYDEGGHLLGEYSNTGVLVQETIWMGDLPVATLRPNGASVSIYYVHTDHLGTARKVTRPSDNGLMWRWDPDTFGSVAPNGNPAGLGTFTYNIRFPGQYALAESGLFYSYFRTYDPKMGRFIESDPIGLLGGTNPYAYVGGNPLSFFDPLGLAAHLNLINASTSSQVALYNWGQSYQPSQYNTILVHGGDDGGFSPDTTGPVRVSPEVMAEELKELPGYDPDLPTQLIACSAGAHPESAQRLANALDATVLASPQTLVSNPPAGPPLAVVTPDSWWASVLGLVAYRTPTWISYPPSNRR